MRKRTKIHEHWEDAIDALSDADRWRLYLALEEMCKAPNDFNAPSEIDFRPTLH